MRTKPIVIAGLVLAGTVMLSAGCSGTAQPDAAPPAAASTSDSQVPGPPAVSATAAAPVTAPPAPPPAPVTKQYDAARSQWQAGATAISAEQGKYWSQAAADLTLGETTDSDPTGYAAAVTMLTQLISLPDAQQTPAQNAEFHADINGLNTFFHTPGLYS
jgi:hypothetical protein